MINIHARPVKINFKKLAQQPIPTPSNPTPTNDDFVGTDMALKIRARIDAIVNQKEPSKQLTLTDRVVDVTEEKPVLKQEPASKPLTQLVLEDETDASTSQENSSLNPFDVADVADVAKEKTSYNPFDNMTDGAKEKTSYNPFANTDDDSRKVTFAPKDASASTEETSALEERFVSKKEGLDWNSDWTLDSGELTPSKPTYSESVKSVFQTLTQRKVLIAAGSVLLLASGGAAAYFFCPVITGAQVATACEAGRVAMVSTNELLIQPGVANTMFMANLLMKVAVIPAVKVSLPVLLPVISTAVVTTLGTLVLLYVANRAWIAAKEAIWNTGAAVVNKFGDELDKTYAGQAVKFAVRETAMTYIDLVPGKSTASGLMIGSSENASVRSSEDTDEETELSSQMVDFSEEEQIAARIQAQNKSERSYAGKVAKAGLVTAGFIACGYLVCKLRQQG